ncbi:hypothetical protein [Frigoribacterium sp. UYMn621]|uniref:hypothetical protein n=1 Tax=Frigoribacterium sp. UYMn621 TaxID=3156343 RepID=UPI003394AABB
MTNPTRLTTIKAQDLGLEHLNDRILVKGSAGYLLGWETEDHEESLITIYLTPSQTPRSVRVSPHTLVTVLDADTPRTPVAHWGVPETVAAA